MNGVNTPTHNPEQDPPQSNKSKSSPKCFIIILILLICAIVSFCCFIGAKSVIEKRGGDWNFLKKVQSEENIEYGEDENQKLDFYFKEEESDKLIVIVHGGAWVLGDKSQFTQVAKFFARSGYSTVNMNYRLTPEWKYDAPLVDISTVLKMVEADKSKFKLKDDYKIILLGHSAGAHLVCLYSLKEQNYDTRNVDYAIGLAGLYDLTMTMDEKDKKLIQQILDTFMGDIPIADASSVDQIKENDSTQFLLLLGDEDELVSQDQMNSFETALEKNNVYVETRAVEGRNHNSLFNKIPFNDEVAQKIIEFTSE